jgi:4'-phosphopantetheinyl transferase
MTRMVELLWPPGPAVPRAEPDDVHVWAAGLDRWAPKRDAFARTLSADEQQRAARYVAPSARDQFIVARGLLRALLARYLDLSPAEIRFGTRGTKPGLLAPNVPLYFNVSHSRSLVLIAVSLRGEVGVDVEEQRTMQTYLDLAHRFFCPSEAQAIGALPPELSEAAFFRVWTRKEAFLKLTGLGLSGGLESFEVSVPPNEPVRLLTVHGETTTAARYTLENLTPAVDYAAALAVEGTGHRLVCWSMV